MDEKQDTMLRKAPIGKLIWKLSVPSVIGIIPYNLYNIINTYHYSSIYL